MHHIMDEYRSKRNIRESKYRIRKYSANKSVRNVIILLLNIIEEDTRIIQELKEEIQRLRDENNRLKGEKGKPKIKPKKKDISSEKERRQQNKKKKRKKRKKKKNLKISKRSVCKIDKNGLPADAEFKGYTPSIVQELEIKVINIEFLKETYYSPFENKTYIAGVPQGFEGDFGPCIKSTVMTLKNDCNVSKLWS